MRCALSTSSPTISLMRMELRPQSRQEWLAMANGSSSNRGGDLNSYQQDLAWFQCLLSMAVNASSVPPLSAIHTEMINEPNICGSIGPMCLRKALKSSLGHNRISCSIALWCRRLSMTVSLFHWVLCFQSKGEPLSVMRLIKSATSKLHVGSETIPLS